MQRSDPWFTVNFLFSSLLIINERHFLHTTCVLVTFLKYSAKTSRQLSFLTEFLQPDLNYTITKRLRFVKPFFLIVKIHKNEILLILKFILGLFL